MASSSRKSVGPDKRVTGNLGSRSVLSRPPINELVRCPAPNWSPTSCHHLASTPAPSDPMSGINTHHPAVRQNFTTAHELAHLLLHEQEKLDVDHSFRFRLRDEVSSQGTEED